LHAAGLADGKVDIRQMRIYMPSVKPRIDIKNALETISLSGGKLPKMPYYMRVCDKFPIASNASNFAQALNLRNSEGKAAFLVVGFQKNRADDQTKNSGLFDNMKVMSAYVEANGTNYPAKTYVLDLNNQTYPYTNAVSFASKLYNKEIHPALDFIEWRSLFNLYVFDLSKQSPKGAKEISNLTINFEFSAAVGANTRAYTLTYYERAAQYKADMSNGVWTDLDEIPSEEIRIL